MARECADELVLRSRREEFIASAQHRKYSHDVRYGIVQQPVLPDWLAGIFPSVLRVQRVVARRERFYWDPVSPADAMRVVREQDEFEVLDCNIEERRNMRNYAITIAGGHCSSTKPRYGAYCQAAGSLTALLAVASY